jgi:hypothetical protein
LVWPIDNTPDNIQLQNFGLFRQLSNFTQIGYEFSEESGFFTRVRMQENRCEVAVTNGAAKVVRESNI